jgi:hypothetical protein
MKREQPSSTGAEKKTPSPGLILDSSSLWQSREKQQSAPSASRQNWNRYIDSRLKQFGSR